MPIAEDSKKTAEKMPETAKPVKAAEKAPPKSALKRRAATHRALVRVIHAGGAAVPGDLIELTAEDAAQLEAQHAVEPLK